MPQGRAKQRPTKYTSTAWFFHAVRFFSYRLDNSPKSYYNSRV